MDLERAFRMYRRAIAAYEQCGLVAEARHLTYALMRLRLRRARVLRLRCSSASSSPTRATAGFGLRPLRVIGTALTLVLLYGLAYRAIAGRRRPRARTAHALAHDLFQWHYLCHRGLWGLSPGTSRTPAGVDGRSRCVYDGLFCGGPGESLPTVRPAPRGQDHHPKPTPIAYGVAHGARPAGLVHGCTMAGLRRFPGPAAD